MALGSLTKAEGMSLKKAGSLGKALIIFMVVMLGPAKAMEMLPWWNVRLFDEMAIYIQGHSDTESGTTQHPPVWNSHAGQWLISLQPPGPTDQIALSLDLTLLYMRVVQKQREGERRNRWTACKGSRSQEWQPYNYYQWEEAGGAGGGSSSHPSSSSTGYTGHASWWEPEEGWEEPEEGWRARYPKWSEDRYYTRGWGSSCKRHERRGFEQRGEPVPDHLLPKKTELSKGLKKEMMELVKKSRKVREASSESDLPEPGKKTEPEKAADTPGDESSSDWSFAGKPRPKRRSESPMPGKHGPRFKGTPPFPERTSVGEKKIKEEEEEDDDDDESEEPEKAKKKKKKRRRKSRKPEKGGVSKHDEPGNGSGGGGADGGGGAGAAPAVTAAA